MAEAIGGVGTFTEAPPTTFAQNLFEESVSAKQRLGTIRPLEDGRVFAYAQAGEALAAGDLNQAAVPDAYGTELAVVSGTAGEKTMVVTYGAGTTATANYYKDGFAMPVMVGYGPGHVYKIRGHAAATSGGSLTLYLYDELRETLTTSSKVSLIKHVQSGVIQAVATTPTGVVTGVAPIDVTTQYYFWNQVKGICNIKLAGNAVVGENLVPSGTAGAVMPHAAVTEVVCAYCVRDATDTYGMVAMLAIPGY